MKIAEVMTSDVAVAAPDMALQDAAQLMRQGDTGFLPVCDGEKLIGTLTDRDIVMRSTAEGHDPRVTPVRQAMSADVVYCFEDQDTNEAAALMAEKQVRRLPILGRDARLTGVLSIGDVATRTPDDDLVGMAVEDISQPAGRPRTT